MAVDYPRQAMDADADERGWRPPKPSRATRRWGASSKFAGRSALVGPTGHVIKSESLGEAGALNVMLADPRVRDVVEHIYYDEIDA